MEGNILTVHGRILCGRKGKGKQYNLSYIIEAVGKNIMWRRAKWNENFSEENQYFKNWGWRKISSCIWVMELHLKEEKTYHKKSHISYI